MPEFVAEYVGGEVQHNEEEEGSGPLTESAERGANPVVAHGGRPPQGENKGFLRAVLKERRASRSGFWRVERGDS
ncbi:hypothetical protein C1H46_026462 [Malus baccata]|uniref:Uncharacterized protein n=1 Tax=Malus baccata TaxID=106549 RepID=A0A540LNA7_MALBA|nr:hypothetical protein C1H46_026462 [Malus baccata]